jgi:hypothetical protein
MKRKTNGLVTAVLVLVPLLAIAGFAAASAGAPSLDPVRDATVRYHDIRAAKKQGFAELKLFGTNTSCIANGAKGAMGIHMVNSKRVGDGKLRATEPESLLYEKRANGTYRFTGVEYIRPIGSEAPAAGTAAPDTLGAEDERHGRDGFLRVADVPVHASRLGLEAEPDRRVQLLEYAGVLLATAR